MSNHHAITKDEAPPAPSRFKAAAAARRAQWIALVDDGRDLDAIREIMGLTSEQARTLAKATGKRPVVDRGAGECREAVAPAGFECDARGGRRR